VLHPATSWLFLREVTIQADDRSFVSVRLDVAIGVVGLADRGVAHLLLNPSEVRSIAQKPCGIRVASCVIPAIGKPSLA